MGLSQQIGASSLIKPGVIDNAAARPASPFEGQAIYQTDTDEVLYYNGTSWSRPSNMPLGLVALGESTTSIGAVSVETLSVTSSSFTAVANRYYKITFNEPAMIYATGNVVYIDLNIRLTNIAGTILQNSSFIMSSANRNAGIVTLIKTFTAGATIVCGTFSPVGGGTASSFHASNVRAAIVVEDIGPA